MFLASLLSLLHRTRVRRSSSWLAIFAIMLHALMPIAAQAHAAGSARMVELCSVAGVKKVTVSADQLPAAPSHPLQHQHCPVCAAAGAAALPTTLQQIFFSALQAAAPPSTRSLPPTATAFLLPASRGPPLAS